jgi:hypothetical protein
MPWDPTRSIQDSPDLSPTTLILNYLKSQGTPITPENIRRAVVANGRGDMLGPDPVPGLRSDIPSTDPEAQSGGRGGGGNKRSSAKPAPAGPVDRHDDTSAPPQSPDQMQQNPVPPRAATMPIGEQVISGLPPGWGGGGGRPVAPQPGGGPSPNAPPPAGAQATIPPPPNPMEMAMQRAIGGPPSAPALPAPPQAPMISGPPPQLALPAPPQAPAPAQLPAPPEVPRIAGPPPQLALPPPDALPGDLGARKPNVTVEQLPSGPAPGKQVQGYPIEQTPASRIIGKSAVGAAKGVASGARAGPQGAAIGGLTGGGEALARELAEYILKGGKLN